jgi:hypothetical protein
MNDVELEIEYNLIQMMSLDEDNNIYYLIVNLIMNLVIKKSLIFVDINDVVYQVIIAIVETIVLLMVNENVEF